MKLIINPEVYIVGRQHLDPTELYRFFENEEISWLPEGDCSDAEIIPEIAGRLCYTSYNKPRPGGNEKYLHHILEVGHGCYDISTEVLTENGWKKWPKVTLDDKLATLNIYTQELEYHKPKRLINFVHKGKMYRVESEQVDLFVTPSHKMVACKTTTKEGRKKENFELISAEELGNSSHAYIKSAIWSKKTTNSEETKDILALLGFSIGDGNISYFPVSQIKFHLRKQRKILWLKTLCSKLEKYGFTLEDKNNGHYTVKLPENNDIRELFADIYDNKEKVIPNILTIYSKNELEGLLEGLLQSDGHQGKTSVGFDSTSQKLIGQVQQLCLHVGLAANIIYTYTKEQRKTSYGSKPLSRLGIIRRTLKPEINKYAGCVGKSSWVEDWEGEVFCAEVPNNTLYVRRNGKTVWSGNSVLEHTAFNFIFTGISRSLSHELIRHRAGVAISQLSQRYVDESVAEYVVPPEYVLAVQAYNSGNTSDSLLYNIGEEWMKSLEYAHKTYCRLVDLTTKKLQAEGLQLSGTELRKHARQAARSVLPNATETKIFWTANVRTIRHFLEQRGSISADKEIQSLALQLLKVCQKEAPNLFNDYEITEKGIETKFRKV